MQTTKSFIHTLHSLDKNELENISLQIQKKTHNKTDFEIFHIAQSIIENQLTEHTKFLSHKIDKKSHKHHHKNKHFKEKIAKLKTQLHKTNDEHARTHAFFSKTIEDITNSLREKNAKIQQARAAAEKEAAAQEAAAKEAAIKAVAEQEAADRKAAAQKAAEKEAAIKARMEQEAAAKEAAARDASVKEAAIKALAEKEAATPPTPIAPTILATTPKEQRAQELLAEALKSKSVQNLYNLAGTTPTTSYELGPWTVDFVDTTENGFEGACDYEKRKINLLSSLSSSEALTIFIFELTNGIQAAQHFTLWDDIKSHRINIEEFAKEAERIEFEGAKIHSTVMSEAIQEMGWDPSLNTYANNPKDFETYWAKIKNSRHTDYYRNAARALI